jgi:hypothetical protein
MTRETVTLEQEQWTQLLGILTSIQMPWTVTNPLIQALGQQLAAQRGQVQLAPQEGNHYDSDLDAQRRAAAAGTGTSALSADFLPGNIARGKTGGGGSGT